MQETSHRAQIGLQGSRPQAPSNNTQATQTRAPIGGKSSSPIAPQQQNDLLQKQMDCFVEMRNKQEELKEESKTRAPIGKATQLNDKQPKKLKDRQVTKQQVPAHPGSETAKRAPVGIQSNSKAKKNRKVAKPEQENTVTQQKLLVPRVQTAPQTAAIPVPEPITMKPAHLVEQAPVHKPENIPIQSSLTQTVQHKPENVPVQPSLTETVQHKPENVHVQPSLIQAVQYKPLNIPVQPSFIQAVQYKPLNTSTQPFLNHTTMQNLIRNNIQEQPSFLSIFKDTDFRTHDLDRTVMRDAVKQIIDLEPTSSSSYVSESVKIEKLPDIKFLPRQSLKTDGFFNNISSTHHIALNIFKIVLVAGFSIAAWTIAPAPFVLGAAIGVFIGIGTKLILRSKLNRSRTENYANKIVEAVQLTMIISSVAVAIFFPPYAIPLIYNAGSYAGSFAGYKATNYLLNKL